jgi:hypothetical protein
MVKIGIAFAAWFCVNIVNPRDQKAGLASA